MLCIASFFVLTILGIFSASHRSLATKAWYCVARRITFKPCDINFSEEIKGKLFAKLIFTHPRLTKFLSKWIDAIAFVFVILTIWSLISVSLAGLNLWVYDTCNPVNAESCSLSGEACGIAQEELSLGQAIEQKKLGVYVTKPFTTFAETVSRIPDRLKSWEAKNYLAPNATYYFAFDPSKPTAVEAIDPGCKFCKKLFENIKTAQFENRYNLSYLVYPIADKSTASGYKFANSYLISSYIEALKIAPRTLWGSEKISPDWQLLEIIFTEKDTDGIDWQTKFNNILSAQEAETQLQKFLAKMKYAPDQIAQIAKISVSEEVKTALDAQRDIVENKLKTIKIPTIVFDGRRFDRVVDVQHLK